MLPCGARWREERVQAELDALLASAAERGCEAGLHGLSEQSEPALMPKLRLLAETKFGTPGPDPSWLLQQVDVMRTDLRDLRRKVDAYFAARRDCPSPSPARGAGWRWVANVGLTLALVGLAMETRGLELGVRGWSALILAGAILSLGGPELPARSREYLEYRKALLRVHAFQRQIAKNQRRSRVGAERRHVMQDWIADRNEAVMSEYRFHRSRGERAREMAA